MLLSIIIPAYNEENTIGSVVEKVLAVTLPNQVDKEILIVNDGSTDQTAQRLEPYASRPGVRLFHHTTNKGKTAATVTGLNEATGDILLIQDADLEYSPDQYPHLIQPILAGETSIVYGSRFKGSIEKMKLINRVANIISNVTFNLIHGTHLTDINTCFKVFTKESFSGITITSDHFQFETEVTSKFLHKGYSVIEVPIPYTARSREEGKKINWSKAWSMYWAIIKFR